MPVLLQAEGVKKVYHDGERILEVLSGADILVRRGEFVSIVGQSGSGKSTLLHILGALDRASSGEITFEGQSFMKMSSSQLARLRAARIGFIYQFHHLLPEFTALENVYLPGMINRRPTNVIVDKAAASLTSVGLGNRLEHRPPKLSGGEQQRVALARAIMNDPLLVLADEPTGDLDQKTGREVLEYVLGQTVEMGRSLVVVTHDPQIAARADRQYRLEAGRLVPG
ncbi:ABC transporter ATP-binding protein [bacterium]|nr:ABC transporter ATP-binding protein [bacterium]